MRIDKISIFLFLTFIPFANISQAQHCLPDIEPIVFSESESTLCEDLGNEIPTVTITNTNSSSLGTTQYSGIVVKIEGIFTINSPEFLFSDCIVQMEPGAQVVVKNGNKLELSNCRVFSCLQMWKGISVEFGGKIYVAQSNIQDAENAIYTNGAAEIVIEDNTFDRNYIALNFNNQWSAIADLLFKGHQILGNRFDCSEA